MGITTHLVAQAENLWIFLDSSFPHPLHPVYQGVLSASFKIYTNWAYSVGAHASHSSCFRACSSPAQNPPMASCHTGKINPNSHTIHVRSTSAVLSPTTRPSFPSLQPLTSSQAPYLTPNSQAPYCHKIWNVLCPDCQTSLSVTSLRHLHEAYLLTYLRWTPCHCFPSPYYFILPHNTHYHLTSNLFICLVTVSPCECPLHGGSGFICCVYY